MKILQVIDLYYPLFSGHAVYITQLVNFLNENKNIKVDIMANSFGKYVDYEKIEGINIFRCNYLKFFSIFSILKKTIRDYDIIHLNTLNSKLFFLIFLLKRKETKIVFQMSLYGSDDAITIKNNTKLGKYKLNFIDYFIPISTPLEESCIEVGIDEKKINKLYQMVDIEKYKPVSIEEKSDIRKKLNLPLDKSIIIFVGSLIQRKGLDVLIDSLQYTNKDFILLLVGPYKHPDVTQDDEIFFSTYKDKINESNRCQLLGKVKNVNEYLKASDIFVLPSRREGFPNTILESMTSKTLVITTKLGGTVENDIFNNQECGYILNNLNSKELAKNIDLALRDSNKIAKMIDLGYQRVLGAFTPEVIVNKYIEFYNKIYGRK